MNGGPKDLESAFASALEVLRVARGEKRPLYCGTNTIEDMTSRVGARAKPDPRQQLLKLFGLSRKPKPRACSCRTWYKDQIVYMVGAEERGIEKLQKLQLSADKQDGEYITIPIKHRESQ